MPLGTDPAKAREWRAEGWIVIEGLEPADNAALEARRLNCNHLADADKIRYLEPKDGE